MCWFDASSTGELVHQNQTNLGPCPAFKYVIRIWKQETHCHCGWPIPRYIADTISNTSGMQPIVFRISIVIPVQHRNDRVLRPLYVALLISHSSKAMASNYSTSEMGSPSRGRNPRTSRVGKKRFDCEDECLGVYKSMHFLPPRRLGSFPPPGRKLRHWFHPGKSDCVPWKYKLFELPMCRCQTYVHVLFPTGRGNCLKIDPLVQVGHCICN